MPKRKGSRTQEEEFNHLMRKVRKLERKIRKNKSDSDGESSRSRSPSVRENSTLSGGDNDAVTPTPLVQAKDWLEPEYEITECIPIASQETPHIDGADISQAGPSTSTPVAQIENSLTVSDEPYLDTDILDILGDDPSSCVKYGPDIRKELACRLQHVATEGLSKECRKELVNKYLIPANCVHIDAPKINPEIKAAIPENFVKRDKGIESLSRNKWLLLFPA
ncbi:hypothetical protein evm_014058 [Chilo suppressalis]|nr:hypothetical protein evm_014058 [Chilo suppressalis]